jgi:hypothetical protein
MRNWFYFINSDPPFSRKARGFVVEISSFELHCIQRDSFVDTTVMQEISASLVGTASASESGRRGSLPPSLRKRICEAVEAHGVLPPDQYAAVMTV